MRVVDVLQPSTAAIRLSRRARDVEERAEQVDSGSERPAPPHTCQRSGAGAAEKPQQDGFGLIAAGMSRRDQSRVRCLGKPRQGGIARFPGRGFQAGAAHFQTPDRLQVEGDAEVARELTDVVRVARRSRPEAVVDVSGGTADTHPDSGREQGHGIGPAGAGDEDRAPVRQPGGDGRFDGVRQISHRSSV